MLIEFDAITVTNGILHNKLIVSIGDRARIHLLGRVGGCHPDSGCCVSHILSV